MNEEKTKVVEQQADPAINSTNPDLNIEYKDTIQIDRKQWDDVQAKLKMLYEVADKGRVYNYESARTDKKPLKVKLSVYNGSIITGWRTIKDELIKHSTTGKTVGEVQEYEVLLLDKNDKVTKAILNGYSAFTDARYTERIDTEVVGKKEDYEGRITFDILLPDGRTIQLGSQFVN